MTEQAIVIVTKRRIMALLEKQMEKLKNFFGALLKNNFAVFTFFFLIIFVVYHTLFNSYFESDEWYYFTYYFPLTRLPHGLLTAIFSIFTKSGYISGGQHIVPIASAIYFLNTKFFGLNFVPYAFMSLFIHALNSFLVFFLIKLLLVKKSISQKNMYAFLGSLFFALSPTPMHAITGFAAFYGQNVLCVTFFLLCIIMYELAFIKKERKFIFLTVLFLFLALFTQESTVFLFFVLPVITLLKKRVFPNKFLIRLFFVCLIAYLILRFLVPNFSSLPEIITGAITGMVIPSSYSSHAMTNVTGLSIYKNLPLELLMRTLTFPFKMTGSIFIPRETLLSIVQFITPVISPYSPTGDNGVQSLFINYSGNSVAIYLLALLIIIFSLVKIVHFIRRKQFEDADYILTGLAIVTLGALPLVAIIFTFPLWGYDIYFDSRHYYNPNVGAALLFPFLIISLSTYIAKLFNTKKYFIVIFSILLVVSIGNIYTFKKEIVVNTQNYSVDRKEIVTQLVDFLPKLKQKTIFYFGKDGTAPFASLPFFTSVPQALTIVYFNRSSLPTDFYDKPLFAGDSEGYQYENGRGFGYYIFKKDLFDAIISKKFSGNDVYGFYYFGAQAKIIDITPQIRKEIAKYVLEAKQYEDWKKFINANNTFTLTYPPSVLITDEANAIDIANTFYDAKLFFTTIPQNFDINNFLQIQQKLSNTSLMQKTVFFDSYHFNNVYVLQNDLNYVYYFQLGDTLFSLRIENPNTSSVSEVEKILGSLNLVTKK